MQSLSQDNFKTSLLYLFVYFKDYLDYIKNIYHLSNTVVYYNN